MLCGHPVVQYFFKLALKLECVVKPLFDFKQLTVGSLR